MSDDEEMENEMLEMQEMQSGFNRELGLDDVEIPVPLSNCHLHCWKFFHISVLPLQQIHPI